MSRIVYVKLLLDVTGEAEAADVTNELLREQLRRFTAGSCLIDYKIKDDFAAYTVTEGYTEGAFCSWGAVDSDRVNLINQAVDMYGSDDVEVDDDALVSEADGGDWVQGWLWVPREEDE